jgi:hypothetical protein
VFSSFSTCGAVIYAIRPQAGRSAFAGIVSALAFCVLCGGCTEPVSHVPEPAARFEAKHHLALHRELAAASALPLSRASADDRTERSVLRGLAWLARFGDDDRRFAAVLSDYTLALAELTLVGSPRSRRLAAASLDAELTRVEARFAAFFPPTIDGKWDFFTVAWAAALRGRPLTRYRAFAERHFPPFAQLPSASELPTAIALRDYDTLGDALIDGSFADDLLRLRPETKAWVPDPGLPALLRRLDGLALEHTRFSNAPAYHRQLYFVTHVILAAGAYGRRALPASSSSALLGRLRQTLVDELPLVRQTSPDTDLLAEMLQCLLLHRRTERGPPAQLEATRRVLLERQRPDGSWRRRGDATHSPYRAMHGTWAASTALATWLSAAPISRRARAAAARTR